MNLQLEGRTALVTGASSRGIGQAIAKGDRKSTRLNSSH